MRRERGIRFAEMLPLEDREARKNLWPQIEQAHRAGKRAYNSGHIHRGSTDWQEKGLIYVYAKECNMRTLFVVLNSVKQALHF